MRRFVITLLVLALIGAGAVEWANLNWSQKGPAAANGTQTVILIRPQTRLRTITEQLEQRGLVAFAPLFEAGLRMRKLSDKVKAGEYAIPSGASMADIAALLVEGHSIQHRLTVAEGLTSEMIWRLVQADPVLEGDAGAAPEEGTLLPETYLFTRGTTRAELIGRMKKAQEKFLLERWAGRGGKLPIRSIREAVILASIVEKETALPQERRHTASVFVNRLRTGMRLQSDPTIIYGLTKGYPLGRGIRESEITGATVYNTYVINALPPGPICNPGKDAIAAVLDPLDTRDLYFVANGTGGHAFAASIAEHQRNVVTWRALERLKLKVLSGTDVPTLPEQK